MIVLVIAMLVATASDRLESMPLAAIRRSRQLTALRTIGIACRRRARLASWQSGTVTDDRADSLDVLVRWRSRGMGGSLSQLIRGAAILAIEDGSE